MYPLALRAGVGTEGIPIYSETSDGVTSAQNGSKSVLVREEPDRKAELIGLLCRTSWCG